jgi:hypothetical protein
MSEPAEQRGRVMQALLQMSKRDIGKFQEAHGQT